MLISESRKPEDRRRNSVFRLLSAVFLRPGRFRGFRDQHTRGTHGWSADDGIGGGIVTRECARRRKHRVHGRLRRLLSAVLPLLCAPEAPRGGIDALEETDARED